MSWRATLVSTAMLSAISIGGCGPLGKLATAHRSTSQFRPTADARVSYEPGAEAMGRQLAAAMPTAVATVEARMFGPFERPIRVYACATIESLTSYGADARAGGHTLNHRIFISPKPENTPERVPRVLTHELSHLHLGQRRGLTDVGNLPVWFVEGLAVDVSGGAGTEGVSEDEARRAIAAGRTFVPDVEGSLFHRRGAGAAGLGEHMFYRQAGMFVSFLRALDRTRFAALLEKVEDGAGLGDAFPAPYGMSVAEAWRQFVAQARP
jgi:hypothetical protein